MEEGRQNTVISHQERIATLIVAGVLLLFGVFWMFSASQFVPLVHLKPIDLTFLPFWAGAILVLTASFLILRYWLLPSRPAEELGEKPLFEMAGQLRVLGALFALAAYIRVLDQVHYVISTSALVAVGLMLSGEPVRPRLFVVAAAVALVLFGIFLVWLGIPLPGSRFA